MQTTKLLKLLAVTAVFGSADYGTSAQTSDSNDTSKMVPTDTSSVSSTTDAIKPDKTRSLRAVDTTAARIDEERVPNAERLTQAAGIAKRKIAPEKLIMRAKTRQALKSEDAGPSRKKPKSLTLIQQLELLEKFMPDFENKVPLTKILADAKNLSSKEKHFIRVASSLLDEDSVATMKATILTHLHNNRNEPEIMNEMKVSKKLKTMNVEYAVNLFMVRRMADGELGKKVAARLTEHPSKKSMYKMKREEDKARLMPGDRQRLDSIHKDWLEKVKV